MSDKAKGASGAPHNRTLMGIFQDESRLRPLQRVVAGAIRRRRGRVPGPIILHSFKKNLYGFWSIRFLDHAMSNSMEWTRGETELFASFTARQLSCEF